jgi:hypothetical protein
VPLLVFSLVSHKEARFLLPLLIPICLLTSHSLFGVQSVGVLRFCWCVFNFLSLILFGYMHQGGVVPSLGFVQKMFTHVGNLEMDQHVIYWHTYMPPRYLAMAPLNHNLINNHRYAYELKRRQIQSDIDAGRPPVTLTTDQQQKVPTKKKDSRPVRQMYDLMSSGTIEQLHSLINDISSAYKKKNSSRITKNYAIFLASPSLLDIELKQTTFNDECFNKAKATSTSNNNQTYFQLQTSFKFHVTFEHLQQHLDLLECDFESFAFVKQQDPDAFECYVNKCKSLNWLQRFYNSFSLNFYQILL